MPQFKNLGNVGRGQLYMACLGGFGVQTGQRSTACAKAHAEMCRVQRVNNGRSRLAEASPTTSHLLCCPGLSLCL